LRPLMRYDQVVLWVHANVVPSERMLIRTGDAKPPFSSRHSQLMKQIKQMRVAELLKKGFHLLNHDKKL
jgi:hypothetical protein